LHHLIPPIKPALDGHHIHRHKPWFLILLGMGLIFTMFNLYADVMEGAQIASNMLPYILLVVALLIALSFEFVNGFHDTANAVATVIYTHALPADVAVIWSGMFNFLGVLFSSGLVAFSIISLLPVDLIIQVGSKAGFAMVFALLLSAIMWNLGTWWLGLPASSSHTMVGAIIGIGLTNSWLNGASATSGVDWSQAIKVIYSLLISPLAGFFAAVIVYKLAKRYIHNHDLYHPPKGKTPPPLWIRLLLIATCSGVSFAHGSNDGQKGMGLIMLILVGTVPTVYALNKAIPDQKIGVYYEVSHQAEMSLADYNHPIDNDPQIVLENFIKNSKYNNDVIPSILILNHQVVDEIKTHRNGTGVAHQAVMNIRNEMYILSESIKRLDKNPYISITDDQRIQLNQLRKEMDKSTKHIPTWVKISVAIALALGTMIGWKRIVVTLGEKIGKTHLTYGQGASAELVAMSTILLGDRFGLPISTTHILSSGIAGTMVANHSGINHQTLINIATAWVLTLPMAIIMSGSFYFLFLKVF
jgi:inorganic phosphate transporter, PiT family